MRFHIGKAEVRLSIGILPLFVVLIVSGEGKALALSLLALLLHEISHWIAARNLGYRMRRMSIYPFGAVMDLERLGATPDAEWIAALAGPLGSFVTASAARLLSHTVPQVAVTFEPFIHANAAIALLNLLPAFPLDGGQIAKQLLTRMLSAQNARRAVSALCVFCSALLLSCGVWLTTKGIPAWSLMLIAPYLLLSAWIERKQPDTGAVTCVLERRAAKQAGAPIRAEIVLLGDGASIGDAMRTLSHRHYTILRIRTDHGTTEIDEDALLDAASRFGYETPMKDVFLH